jgi:hypothetical protein
MSLLSLPDFVYIITHREIKWKLICEAVMFLSFEFFTLVRSI